MQINREVNLFEVQHKYRDYSSPATQIERKVLGRFGEEYFNSPFVHGYHGYEYNGLYRAAAKNLIEFYGLRDGSKILDIGCAKGFLLHDLKELDPTFRVYGIDLSRYAIENAMPSVKANLVCTSASSLPYGDSEFDLVVSINTLLNLSESDCRKATREINRVGKTHRFVQVPSYRTETERRNLVNWVPTAQTVLDVGGWKQLLSDENFDGEYYWFIFHDL